MKISTLSSMKVMKRWTCGMMRALKYFNLGIAKMIKIKYCHLIPIDLSKEFKIMRKNLFTQPNSQKNILTLLINSKNKDLSFSEGRDRPLLREGINSAIGIH